MINEKIPDWRRTKTLKEFAEALKEIAGQRYTERDSLLLCFGSQDPLRGIEALVVKDDPSMCPPERELAKKIANPMQITCHPRYKTHLQNHYLIRIMDCDGIKTKIDFVAENKDLQNVSCGDNGAGGYVMVLPSSIDGTTLRIYHDSLD